MRARGLVAASAETRRGERDRGAVGVSETTAGAGVEAGGDGVLTRVGEQGGGEARWSLCGGERGLVTGVETRRTRRRAAAGSNDGVGRRHPGHRAATGSQPRSRSDREGKREGVGEVGWFARSRGGVGNKGCGVGRPGGPGSPVGPNSPGKDGSSFVLFFFACLVFVLLFFFYLYFRI